MKVTIEFDINYEEAIKELCAEQELSPEQLIKHAVRFYKTMMDHRKRGNKVIIKNGTTSILTGETMDLIL